MKLTCKVNQNAALKRGFDPHSTAVLEFDIAALTDDERAVLAEHFHNGEFRYRDIPTPDLDGLRSVLAERIAANREQESKNEERRAEVRERFAKRETDDKHGYSNEHEVVVIADPDDNPVVRDDRTPDHNGVVIIEKWHGIKPFDGFFGEEKDELKRLMETPEGKAWRAELDAENKRRREAAVAAAIARFPQALVERQENRDKEAAKERRKEAADETLRGVIREHGTAMQIERMNRDLTDWPAEALELMSRRRITNAAELPEFDRPHQYETDTAEVLTDDEMALVLRYEHANPGATVTVETLDEDDVGHDEYGDPEDPGRHIRVQLVAEHGIRLVRLFTLEES